MNNHKTYDSTELDITYRVLEYTGDDNNDNKFIQKFINKYENCKVIERNSTFFIPDDMPYHPYYNPGIPLSGTKYYKNSQLILQLDENEEMFRKRMLQVSRKQKLKRLKW